MQKYWIIEPPLPSNFPCRTHAPERHDSVLWLVLLLGSESGCFWGVGEGESRCRFAAPEVLGVSVSPTPVCECRCGCAQFSLGLHCFVMCWRCRRCFSNYSIILLLEVNWQQHRRACSFGGEVEDTVHTVAQMEKFTRELEHMPGGAGFVVCHF